MSASSHLSSIHECNCVVCIFWHGKKRNCDEAHHLEWDRGPWSAWATIPLCKSCHDEMHQDRRRAFYRQHKGMSDVSLLARTIELLEAL